MRGAGESLCGTPMFSTNIDGTAALSRPDMPHTLRSPSGGVKAATAPPFMAAQGLASAAGTRALTPRDPVFTSFPEKRSKTRKAAAFLRKFNISLRHKLSKRHKNGALAGIRRGAQRREPSGEARRQPSTKNAASASGGFAPRSGKHGDAKTRNEVSSVLSVNVRQAAKPRSKP